MNYEEIPLAPEAASVGLEIRVIGNDSSEKVYIYPFTFEVTVVFILLCYLEAKFEREYAFSMAILVGTWHIFCP